MSRLGKRKRSAQFVPRVKVWIEIDGSYVFGRGISEILKAVEKTGSIKQAANLLGKSYRHIWNRVKEAETALGASLVETQIGGKDTHRSDLTELGRQLIAEFDCLRGRMNELLEEEFTARFKDLLNKR